ncbi:MAG: sugar ABC transporter substrate-binding protein [Erysipelotrichaceae bacterium]
MKTMKRVMKLMLVALVSLSLTACSSAGDAAQKVIGISMNAADEYCTALLAVMEQTAKDAGYKVVATNANGSPNKQISDVESLVAQNPSVIIVRAVDPSASAPAVEASMSAGIKTVIIDLPIFDADYTVRLTSDQGRVGELIGEHLNAWLAEDSTRVANLGYIKGNDIPPTAPRRTRLLETATAANELITATTSPDWSVSAAQAITNDWLSAYPEMNVIAAMSDELANAAIQALIAAGKNPADYLIYGCDGSKNGLLAVENGEMAATVITDPTLWGVMAMELAIDVETEAQTFEVNAQVDGTDSMVLVTKDNVSDYLSK